MKCGYHPEHEAVGTCIHCGKGVCELCKSVVGDGLYCPNCIEKTLDISSAPTKSTKRGVPLWVKAAGGVIAIIVIVIIVSFAGGNDDGLATYEISISGTSGVAFSGSFLILDSNKSPVSQSVEGIIPQTYTVTGSEVSVWLQKQGDSGTLEVQILKDSTVVTQSITTDAFGEVSLAAVSGSSDIIQEAYNIAYETTKSIIQVAVLHHCSYNMMNWPVLDGTYSINDCRDCHIIDMSVLMVNQGGLLFKMPDGCHAAAGSNNDNCDGGATGCSASNHYVWILSEFAAVHSKCMGPKCNSNDDDGYQGVWP